MAKKILIKKTIRRRKPEFSFKFFGLVLGAIWKVIKISLQPLQELKNILYIKKLRKKNRNKEETIITRPKKKLKKKKKKLIGKFFIFSMILLMLAGGSLAIWISNLTIPSIEEIQRLKISQATKIFDKDGELLYNIYGEEKRTIVEIEDISQHMIDASISVEDKDFYNHSGVKISSILKAAWENQFGNHKYQRGGSTITQQVIKNTILTREKTYTRKIKEAILAYKLEKIWSKKQILELYLNEAAYGGTIYGVEEAAQYYFGIPAKDLDIAQSAYLAAMPQAPTTYSPYGSHRDQLDKRKNLILSLMLSQGYINNEEYQKAKKEKVDFVFKSEQTGIKAPHFVMYVIDELKKQYTQNELRNNGLRVYTTLDLKLQNDLQTIVKKHALENEKKYKAKNAGVVVIDSKTGHILAMVGSRDYFDKEIDGKFNIATAKRQPGSSFKPIVYLTALQKGYTPDTIIWDVPTEFSYQCLPGNIKKKPGAVCYHPQNFDYKFKGPMKLKYALPESRNIPAVKFLYLVGVQSALDNAKLLGIKSLNKGSNYYGLNLVLGGGEVQLLNLVSVYSVFSNGGVRAEPIAISKITDINGKIISEPLTKNKRVVDEKEVLWLSNILSTKEYKVNTFGWNSPLYYDDRQVAVKTGTTDNYRDAWTVGYDPSVAVGVWVGNNDNTSMKPSKAAHLLWRASMDRVLEGYPNIDFKKPEEINYSGLKPALRGIWQGNKIIRIDTKNNTLADENTPEEFVKEIAIPEYHTILHWINKSDPNGPVPENDKQRDDLYANWEAGVQAWVTENKSMVSDEIKNLLQLLLKLKPKDTEEDGTSSEEPVVDLEANL